MFPPGRGRAHGCGPASVRAPPAPGRRGHGKLHPERGPWKRRPAAPPRESLCACGSAQALLARVLHPRTEAAGGQPCFRVPFLWTFTGNTRLPCFFLFIRSIQSYLQIPNRAPRPVRKTPSMRPFIRALSPPVFIGGEGTRGWSGRQRPQTPCPHGPTPPRAQGPHPTHLVSSATPQPGPRQTHTQFCSFISTMKKITRCRNLCASL